MKVLITGGSGLIGTAITQELLDAGHEVVHLSRRPNNKARVKQYLWDIDKQILDPKSFQDTHAIINLAGATLNHRWTPEYKSLILRSRVDGTRLLCDSLQELPHQVETFISASAAGYYPSDLQKIFEETDAPGSDFMSLICEKWEAEALRIEELGIRTIRSRIGIVLSDKGGALPAMAKPVRYGAGAALGSGRQLMSWIHINDLAKMFLHVLQHKETSGAYNFVGPNPLTNKKLTEAIARALAKPLILPAVPAIALKLVLGEMAEIVLRSNGLDHKRIGASGFEWEFNEIQPALSDLLK